MSGGAPRRFYAPQTFFIISLELVKDLDGSWPAAACFQRIAWRSEREGYWEATMEEIAEEIGVSVRTAKTITKALREKGYVTSERGATWTSTLTWRPVFEGETAGREGECSDRTPESADVALSGGTDPALTESADVALAQGADVALPSLQTEETRETLSNPSADADGATPKRDLNAGREDVDRLCEHLHQVLTARGVRHNHTTKGWRDAARLLVDADGHPEEKVHRAIEWADKHYFWHKVILSMPNLRDKYDTMRLQAQSDGQGQSRRPDNVHVSGGSHSASIAAHFTDTPATG